MKMFRRYIAAQIFGGYVACLLVYVQYKDLINVSRSMQMAIGTVAHSIIQLVDEGLAAKGLLESVQFTPNGTGGIFGLYTIAGANLSRVFLNEFVSVSYCAQQKRCMRFNLNRMKSPGYSHRSHHLGLHRPHKLPRTSRSCTMGHQFRLVRPANSQSLYTR